MKRRWEYKGKRRAAGVIVTIGLMALMTGCNADKEKNVNIAEGMEKIEQADYNGALESFEAALVYKEDGQLLYRGEGLAYMGLGDYEQAAEKLLTSISYAEGNVTDLEFDTNYYLAACYYKLEQYSQAAEIYSAIIGLRDSETDAYFLRACTYLKAEDYELAVADFQKAFALEPDNLDLVTDAYLEMCSAGYETDGKAFVQNFMDQKGKALSDSQKGTLYYYLGNYDDARLYLDGALNGKDAQVSLILGKTYEKLGDMNYAAVVYNTYLESNAPDAAIYNSLGTCLMAQGKYTEALQAYESGLEMGDSAYIKELSFNRIAAKEYLGEFSQAKQLMAEYIEKYPDDVNAIREYEFLQTR